MLNQLPPIIPVSSASPAARPELRQTGDDSRALAVEMRTTAPGSAHDELAGAKLERLAQAAAKKLFPGHEVAVESFYDEGSGRYVHRIADRESGELLLQTPPDELLRFFASGREPYGAPLLEIDA